VPADAIAIVGGGMMGLSLAYRLATAGRRVTVYESAPRAGGLVSGADLATSVRWDRFYHVILASDAHTRLLLRDIGIEGEVSWTTTGTGVFAGGRLMPASTPLDLLRIPGLRPLDLARIAATLVRAGHDSPGRLVEWMTCEEWLTRWSGRRAWERFWRPLLRSKLGEDGPKASASFIVATLKRLGKARRAGLDRERFGWVRGGYERVADRLVEVLKRHGAPVRAGAPVSAVTPVDGGLAVRAIGTGTETYDRVVICAPGPAAARLCPAWGDDERRRLADPPWMGVVNVAVLMRSPLSGRYVTNLLDDGLPFTGVIEVTAVVDPAAVGGHHLVHLPRYVAAGDPLFDAPDAEVAGAFLAGLERVKPAFRRSDAVACRVFRARHVMPFPVLHRSHRVPPVATSVPGLFVLNGAQIDEGTANVDETVRLAGDFARSLLGGS